MTTTRLVATQPVSPTRPAGLLRRAWAFNKLLTLTVLVNVALIPVILLVLLMDPVTIGGVNGWVKPLKFTTSIAIYAATLIWLLTLVRGRRRWVQLVANLTALALLTEIGLITLQVVRGTTSHFNLSTPLDAAIFSTMGVSIALVAGLTLLLGLWLTFQPMPDPVKAWAVRLGVLLSLSGMVVGFLMTAGPTPAQLAALQAGQPLTTIGAHSVGVADGGPGLPLLGWSTTGGDLRIGHFLGLHAMQVLPLLGYLLTRPTVTRRLRQGQRLGLLWAAALGYLGLTALVTWQALRGQPLLAPDAITGLAAGLLGVAVVAAVWLALLLGRRQPALA